MLQLFGSAFMLAAWLLTDHYPPWMSAYSDGAMAMSLILFLAAVSLPVTHKPARAVPAVFWWITAIALIPWFQWLTGKVTYSGDAIVGSLYVLGLACAVLCGNQWAQRQPKDSAAWLASTLLIGASISAALALFQASSAASLGHWMLPVCPGGRACANLAQPNNLGTLLGLGAAGLLLLREQNRFGSWPGGLLLALLLLGAAASQSRTAMLYGPAILLGLFIAHRKGLPVQTSSWVAAGATAAHWLLAWIWPSLERLLLLDATAALNERRLGAGRLEAWSMFLDATTLFPWSGFGWLQTASAQLAVAERHPALHSVWQQTHNLFIELLVWCGYPLGLLLCGLLVFWFVHRVRRVQTVEGVVGMISVTLLGIHSMTELPYHYAYLLIPVGLWVGHVESSVGAGVRRWTSLPWIPVAVSLCLVTAVLRDYAEVESDFRLARFEGLRIGTLKAAQPAPDAPFLSGLTAQLRLMRTQPVAGMSIEQLDAMESTVRRFPSASSMAKLAWAWAMNDRLTEATQMFVKIRFVHGEVTYQKLKKDLHERVEGGRRELSELAAAVP